MAATPAAPGPAKVDAEGPVSPVEVIPPAMPGWWRVPASEAILVVEAAGEHAGDPVAVVLTGAAEPPAGATPASQPLPESIQEAMATLQGALATLSVASLPEVRAAVAEIRALEAADVQRGGAYDDLRVAVDNVAARRRDVDTMLALVNHLEAIEALQQSHADLRAAATRLAGLIEAAGTNSGS